MIPTLPARKIRDALDGGDWEAASGLLTAHEAELREALATEGCSTRTEPLMALLNAQRAFLEELKTARDDAARALGKLGRDRRGVAAYAGTGDG